MNKLILHFLFFILFPISSFADQKYTAADFDNILRAAELSEKTYQQPKTLKCKNETPQKPTLREEFESYWLYADRHIVNTEELPQLKRDLLTFIAQIESGKTESQIVTTTAVSEIYRFVKNSDAKCGMTIAEHHSLGAYIGSGYYDLNKYLRGSKNPAEPMLDRFELLLNRAMNKIANHTGYLFRSSVFTGNDYPDSVYRLHKVGSEITYGAFTSTAWSTQFHPNFIIYSRTAKDISPLNSSEAEILFHSRTRFKVLYNSCEEQNLSTWQRCNVLMTEIPAA